MEVDILVDHGALHLPQAAPVDESATVELGPGWFESSRALQTGLWVCEAEPGAAVGAADLPRSPGRPFE